jgi:hypothetical protein
VQYEDNCPELNPIGIAGGGVLLSYCRLRANVSQTRGPGACRAGI